MESRELNIVTAEEIAAVYHRLEGVAVCFDKKHGRLSWESAAIRDVASDVLMLAREMRKRELEKTVSAGAGNGL